MDKTVAVEIKGISAMLMHKFPMTEIKGLEKMTPEEQAEHAAYRDPDTGELYVPGINIQRALIAAAAFSKGKGRASLQKPVAACLLVEPERISLGVKDYAIDSRRVVIAATKGAVIRHRPRIDNWTLTFQITWDMEMMSEKEVRQVLDDCGKKVGLMDFRPERKGPFGRFMVTEWKEIKDEAKKKAS